MTNFPILPDPLIDPESAQAAGQAVADGAKWIGKQTVAAADWTGQKTTEIANRVVDAYKNTVRSTIRPLADVGYDVVGVSANTVQSVGRSASDTANAVSDAAKSVKDALFGRDPSSPCIPCQQAAAAKAREQAAQKTDLGADGCLMTAGCKPLCKQGKKLTRAELKKARANPVTPDGKNSCCQKKRAAWAAQGKPIPQITYVNGILTTRQTHCATLQAIANQKCANVIGVYNATEGGVSDAIQTSQDRLLIKAANDGSAPLTHDGRNPAVDTTSDIIFQDMQNNGTSTVYCHSQGGAITSLASYDALNSLEGSHTPYNPQNLQVTSFGSAAPYWPSGINGTHYVNVNDATPTLFGLGVNQTSDATRAPGADVVRFSGPPAGPWNTDNVQKDWLPAPKVNHDVDGTYLGVARQRSANLATSGQGEADCG